MKTVLLLFIAAATLVSASFTPSTALAHHQVVYIRGLRYNDHTHSSRNLTQVVNRGAWVSFQNTTFPFIIPGQPRDFRVVIQDINTGSGGGVTAFRLTNVRVNGNTVSAQIPFQQIFANRSYYITIYSLGAQPWHYAYGGVIRIR